MQSFATSRQGNRNNHSWQRTRVAFTACILFVVVLAYGPGDPNGTESLAFPLLSHSAGDRYLLTSLLSCLLRPSRQLESSATT